MKLWKSGHNNYAWFIIYIVAYMYSPTLYDNSRRDEVMRWRCRSFCITGQRCSHCQYYKPCIVLTGQHSNRSKNNCLFASLNLSFNIRRYLRTEFLSVIFFHSWLFLTYRFIIKIYLKHYYWIAMTSHQQKTLKLSNFHFIYVTTFKYITDNSIKSRISCYNKISSRLKWKLISVSEYYMVYYKPIYFYLPNLYRRVSVF